VGGCVHWSLSSKSSYQRRFAGSGWGKLGGGGSKNRIKNNRLAGPGMVLDTWSYTYEARPKRKKGSKWRRGEVEKRFFVRGGWGGRGESDPQGVDFFNAGKEGGP